MSKADDNRQLRDERAKLAREKTQRDRLRTDAIRFLERERDEARADADRMRADFPPAPPLAVADCECAACVRLRVMWSEPDVRRIPSVREAARRRMPLDGADAQCIEHAITITERERDEARARVRELEEATL